MALRGAQKRMQKKGVVPFLGTFLTELVMLDTAMEDYLEGNEINHQKRNKEYQVMTDIMLLQVAAENYTLEPEDPFWAWFQAMEPLSEAESYTLSCQLEPRS
ncbi:ral guanine nucleotide dissociation stimulator-like isoform X2 [Ursus americanus]|nr:ral guanine nucleotide dissociation stimulator-like isoform X2 [Ursus americanus]